MGNIGSNAINDSLHGQLPYRAEVERFDETPTPMRAFDL